MTLVLKLDLDIVGQSDLQSIYVCTKIEALNFSSSNATP